MPHPLTGHLRSAMLTICLTGLAVTAQASVEPGHWAVANWGPNPDTGNTSIWVDQTAGGDYTGSFLAYNAAAGTLSFRNLNVDEGSELFLVQPGDALTQTTQGNFLSLYSTYNTPVQVGRDFYLGAGTRSGSDPGFSWADHAWTSFGWAHFRADEQGQLSIVDSAMAFREPGIVVGTLTTAPESSTFVLMGLGLLGVAGLRRQHQSPRTERHWVARS